MLRTTLRDHFGVFLPLLISLGLFNSGWVKFFFSPQVEGEEVVINVRMPPGTPFDRSMEVLGQLQRAEKALEAEVQAEADTEGGKRKLIEGWATFAKRSEVTAILQLAPPDDRQLGTRKVAERLADLVGDIPDADEVKFNYSFKDSDANITLLLQHDDLDTLLSASLTLQQHLASFDRTNFIRDDQWGALPELRFRLLPGAEKLGITMGDVSTQVRQAFYGEEVQRLPREGGDVRVMVRYPQLTVSLSPPLRMFAYEQGMVG